MENTITILTEKDKAILESYMNVADGLADFWGGNCEVVVHDLSHLDSSVIKIINGHLSGRQTGAPISEVTLGFLNKMMANPAMHHVTYFAKNKRGEAFKASISAIEGENHNIIGLFCINFYLNASLLSFMQTFTPAARAETENISETFVENAEELMLNMSEQKYVLDLTKSQAKNLAEFLEFNFINSIREDEDIDNIWYLCDMCDIYKALDGLNKKSGEEV